MDGDGRRILLDTCVLWAGALSPGSDAYRLATTSSYQFFISSTSVREMEDQLRARVDDEGKRLAIQILIEDFAKRVGAEVGDDSDLVDSAGAPPTTNDQRIALAAEALGGTVCTYNVRHFEEATTPAQLLRDDAFFERSFEVPASQTEGTILYMLRVHGLSTSIGGLLKFDDGTVVEGIDRRRLRIRFRVDGKERVKTSNSQLPDGQLLGLVVRYERDSQIIVDAWHPSGRNAVPDEEWKVGSSGNMRLVSAPTSKTLRLTNFGRPSNCEFFGASTAPTALNDRQVSLGIESESLDASYRSEELGSLLDSVEYEMVGGQVVMATASGAANHTTYLPPPPWFDPPA